MRKLDEIRADLAAVLTEADESGGELSEGLLEELDRLEMELPEKLDMCEAFATSCLVSAADAKKRAAYWNHVAKMKMNHAERMRARIFDTMQGLGITKIETKRFTLSLYKKADGLKVTDEARMMMYLPDKYVRTKPAERSPDKKAMLDALKAGYSFIGVELVTDGQRLSVK